LARVSRYACAPAIGLSDGKRLRECLYLPEADLKTTLVIDGVVSRLRV
jgi:hypothetical protein